jgi:hypothetical protein
MGQLIIPAQKEVDGPWLLSVSDLESLDKVIEFVKKRMEEAIPKIAKIRAKTKLTSELKASEEIIKDMNQSKSFRITFISSDDKQIISDSVKKCLTTPNIKDFKTKEMKIHLSFDYRFDFSLEVRGGFDGKLFYELNCVDQAARDEISYKIERWMENTGPSKLKQLWFKYSFGLGLLAVFFAVFFTSLAYFVNSNPTRNEIYGEQIVSIIETGVNDSNHNLALETLLKYSYGYLPDDYTVKAKFSGILSKMVLICIAGLLILLIKPKTTIGVGKHKTLLRVYEVYSNLVFFIIPSLFLIPFVVDLIKRMW